MGKELWRPRFHFTANKGWINDPNGLIFFRGQYHLFYQYNPYGCNWDSMHWGHAVSDDLVHWHDLPIALTPDQPYDHHREGGCFSGSAIEKDGILYLFYTGSIKDENGIVRQTQCMAYSEDGVHFVKSPANPLIKEPPEENVTDFRDPKVFHANGMYYMVVGGSLGGADTNGDGRIYLYRSADLYEWSYCGILVESNGQWGTMMECPDMFPLGEYWVITGSPMYHPAYYHNMYFIGKMDFENCRFAISNTGKLDYGFDYYAAQSFVKPDGERITIAWQNGWKWMPWFEDWGPTGIEGWRGVLSIPRRLYIDQTGQLCGELLPIWRTLRRKECYYENLVIDTEKKVLSKDARSLVLDLSFNRDELKGNAIQIGVFDTDNARVVVHLDVLAGILSLERDQGGGKSAYMHAPFCTQRGDYRLQIIADGSSVICSLNNGERSLTCNAYPAAGGVETWIRVPAKTATVSALSVEEIEEAIR